MCGIAGIVSERLAGSGELRPAVERMLRTMRHRGPDGHGVHVDGSVALGSDRLAILDTRPIPMPLATQDGRIVLAYNGELYNHVELRAELEAKGATFATRTDTEVVAEAYRAWGAACVERFVGMFAFVLLDSLSGAVFGARDRLGKKPFFFRSERGLFAFASFLPSLEDAALERAGFAGASVDGRSMLDLIELGWIHGPRSALREVSQLPPAHRFTLVGGMLRIERYWSLAEQFREGVGLSPDEHERLAASVEPLLLDAVRRRLVADVPVGAFLSGGLDSSIITACMREVSSDPVKTFTVAFDVLGFDESEHAARVAQHLGTQHLSETMALDDPSRLLRVQERMGEPLADTSVLPTFLVSEVASRHVKVALSGDGADELFAGYETFKADRIHAIASRLPAWPLRPLANWAAGLLPSDDGKVSLAYKAKRFASGLGLEAARAHGHWRALRERGDALAALTGDARAALREHDPLARFVELDAELAACDAVNRASYVDLSTYLPDDILVKVDRASMGSSLEARSPFLDHRLVEVVARLPGRYKLRGFTTKWLLREQHARRLPPQVLSRRKEGFSSPVSRWLRGPLRELFFDLVTPQHLAPLGLDAAAARGLHADLDARRGFPGFALWSVLSIAAWHDARRRGLGTGGAG